MQDGTRMSRLAKWYLATLSLAWALPAWWLGASNAGGQWLLLALSLVAGALGVILNLKREHRRRATVGLRVAYAVPLLFLLYVLAQALNPAWGFDPGWPVGTLFELPHVEWLPSGIAAPFSAAASGKSGVPPFENSWRYLLVFGGAATLVFATASGVRGAAMLRRWLEIMLTHAAIFSAFALIHNLSGSRLTYWIFYDPANRLGGPQFPNDNQQSAYQVILLAITLAAARVRSDARPFPQLEEKRRGRFFGGMAVLVWLGVVSSHNRAGILLGAALGAFALAQMWWRSRLRARLQIAAVGVCCAAVLASVVLVTPALRQNFARFSEFQRAPAQILHGGSFRPLQHEAAWLMFKDARVFGWGGGCYLYLFFGYYRQVPGLAAELDAQGVNRIVFPHADGDWLEFLAEYGLAGMALLLAPLVRWLAWLLPRARRLRADVWLLAGGVACVLAQATIDPVLRNPAVLSGLAGAAWLAVKLHRQQAAMPKSTAAAAGHRKIKDTRAGLRARF